MLRKSALALLGFPSLCVLQAHKLSPCCGAKLPISPSKTSDRGGGRQDVTAIFHLLSQPRGKHLPRCCKPVEQVGIQGEHGAPLGKWMAAGRLF